MSCAGPENLLAPVGRCCAGSPARWSMPARTHPASRRSVSAARTSVRCGERTATPIWSVAQRRNSGSLVLGSDADHAWAAGFIDGDGSIHLNGRRQHGYRTRVLTVDAVQVGSKVPPSLQRLQDLYGGSIRIDEDKPGRPIWRWRVIGKHAEACLRVIVPFLVEKRVQGELALEAREHASGQGKVQLADEYEARLRAMKRETDPAHELHLLREGLVASEGLNGERWAKQREEQKGKALSRYHRTAQREGALEQLAARRRAQRRGALGGAG